MRFGLLSLVAALPAASAFAAPLLGPGDAIFAIDTTPISNSAYPGGEAPGFAIDGDNGTKYLNFGGSGTGLIVTPAFGSSIVQSLALVTGNDAPDRDPSSYELFGTNDSITSADNSRGLAENWTPVSSGLLAPPADRNTAYPIVDFANAAAYTSYRLVFPALGGSNLMQVSEIDLFTGLGGTGDEVLVAGDAILAIDDFSAPPPAEDADKAIDGDAGTKYLSFGRSGSGVIVTPAGGSSVAKSMKLTTANDFPVRDATSFEVYGTNDPVTSSPFGTGEDENWVLIKADDISLPVERLTESGFIQLDNDTAYTSYKIVFPSIGDDSGEFPADSFQVAEIQLFDVVPEPGSVALLGLGGLALLRRRK